MFEKDYPLGHGEREKGGTQLTHTPLHQYQQKLKNDKMPGHHGEKERTKNE